MVGYIYSIINKINGKRYIGQTINLERRKNEHFRCLRNNNHPNFKLQKDWNDWGEENFIFEYTEYEIQEHNELNNKEKEAIKLYNTFQQGYNLTEGGDGGTTRRKLTYEQYCLIYYGCQWQGMTTKISEKMNIDSSIISSVLREKAHLDYLERSKKELTAEQIWSLQQQFKEMFDIPLNKQPDKDRSPSHLTEEEYFYCFCVASSYGRGIESSLGKYFNKDKSFLANGLKAAKTQGKIKRAYDKFVKLSDAEILKYGMEKFNEWNIQSYCKTKIKQESNNKWRQ